MLPVCLSIASAALGQDAPLKRAVARRAPHGVVKVDGHLDEAAWGEGSALADFTQKEPVEGVPPTEPTEAWFLYDDEALFVGVRLHKRPGRVIQAPMGRRDRFEQSEYVLVALDTFLDRRTAYVFGVTASGVRIDRFHPRDDEGAYDEGYSPVWQARTSVDERGWSAEFWIPFSQLRFNDQPQQVWGLNLRRSTPTFNEDDYWAPVPRTVTAWSSRFGRLSGIEGLPSNRRIEVMPYGAAASTVNSNRDPANPFDDGKNLGQRVGADLKVGLGPNLTLDATFNPDFGQVEADPAEVNLTAFETIFPERRPFFSEGANLLAIVSGNNFFYSRRIGAPPVGPAPGDFVEYPRTSAILSAAKLTGRLNSGTSLGLLAAVTNDEEARVFSRSLGSTGRVRVAPRTEFAVAKVQQEFGRNKSTVGALVTLVHRHLDPGEPLSDLLVGNAVTMAGDGTIRFKGGEYEISPWVGASFLSGTAPAVARAQRASAHFAQRPDRDYTLYDPTATSMPGYKFGAIIRRTGGRHWVWTINNDYESPGFETNDIGRLLAADGMQLTSDVRYRETVPGRRLRGYFVGVNQNSEWNFGRSRQTNNTQIYSEQTWNNFWATRLAYTARFRVDDARLTRGGPEMERPRNWTLNGRISGRPSGQTSWSAETNLGGAEDGGRARQFIGHLGARPGPRWQLSIDPNLLQQLETQQYVATLDGGPAATFGKRYVFGAVDRQTYAVQFRVGYTLKPDVNIDVYAEPFAANGRYSKLGELAASRTQVRREYGTGGTTVTRQPDGSVVVTDGSSTFRLANSDFNVRSFRSNVVLRWEYRPGSLLYFVWQQNRRMSEPIGDRISLFDPFRALSVPGTNYFVVKASLWKPLK